MLCCLQIKAQLLSADQILSKVSDSTFASTLGKNLNSQLAALGLAPVSVQILSISVIYPPTSASAVLSQPLTSAALLRNSTWLTTILSAIGNFSRCIEIANLPFQAVEISADQFSLIWGLALPLTNAVSVSGVAFFAVPGAILLTVPGAVYSPGFSMAIKTRQILSSGVAFAAIGFNNVTDPAPLVRLLQYPLRGQRRGWCPATGTDWRTSLANATAEFACNCAAAAGCGGGGVSCEMVPISGDVWLPSATDVTLCTSPDQHLRLGLGLGIGLLFPLVLFAGIFVRHVLLCRRRPPERRRRKPEASDSVGSSDNLNRDAGADAAHEPLPAGDAATRPTRTPSPQLPSTPRSHASQERPR